MGTGDGPQEFRGGSLNFACPEREGQHKFDTTKSCLSINFIAYRGRVTFFSTKNMTGGLGDFTFMLIGIPPAHPPLPPF